MQYNIHPIFVHFPIALLCLYSIIQIIPFKKWLPKIAWTDVGFIMLVVGVLGAFVALMTGEVAEEMVRANDSLVELHAFFAGASTWLYGALLVGELSRIITSQSFIEKASLQKAKTVLVIVKKILHDSFFAKIVVVVALLSIGMTGLLGGALVYGTTADPFTGIVLKIFGITI